MSVQLCKTGIINAAGDMGANLILDSANKTVSHLESGNEFISINLGQSYMDLTSGTQVTFSFDIEIKIGTVNNYLQVYNTNYKGPKTFSGVNVGSQIYADNPSVGDVVKKRVYATTSITDRDSPTATDNYIEFYSVYNTGNVFKISNLKCEVGAVATPWCPNENDAIFTGSNQGFIESGSTMKVYDEIVQSNEFIEL